jgi:tetratricopeptide (TPR) repeat protein
MAASAELAETLGALRHSKFQEAVKAGKRLVQAFPDELDAQLLLADSMAKVFFDATTEETEAELTRQVSVLKRLAPGSPYSVLFESAADPDHRKVIDRLTELLEREDMTPSFRVRVLRMRGWRKRHAGDPAAGATDMEAALRLEPANASTLSDLGYILREADRGEEALLRVKQAIAMEPGTWRYRHSLGHVQSGLGRFAEAAEAYRRACEMSELQQPCAAYAGSLEQTGHASEAEEAARRAGTMEDSLAGVYNLACFHALRGERDPAIDYLRRTLELGWDSAWMASDPDLESLHGDPEFEAIIAPLRKNADE